MDRTGSDCFVSDSFLSSEDDLYVVKLRMESADSLMLFFGSSAVAVLFTVTVSSVFGAKLNYSGVFSAFSSLVSLVYSIYVTESGRER